MQADLDKEIDAAVADFSVDEPRVVLVDKVPGDLVDVAGVKFFKLSPTWDPAVSNRSEVEIEFPVDQARKSILRRGDDLDFTIEERPTGTAGAREFWVKFFNPPSGTPGTWRLSYSTSYPELAADATLATLTARAVKMVGLLAAVYTARFLSAKFGKTEDATLAADVVDYRGKAAEWREIAETLWKEYQDRLDRPSKIKRPGTDVDVVDLDLTVGRNNKFGRNYLVHRRRRR